MIFLRFIAKIQIDFKLVPSVREAYQFRIVHINISRYLTKGRGAEKILSRASFKKAMKKNSELMPVPILEKLKISFFRLRFRGCPSIA